MKINIEDIKKLAKQAGRKTLEFYTDGMKVYRKEDHSPVTKADMESNKIIEKGLGKYGRVVLSEEGTDDKRRLGAEEIWIVDPLDGTEDFIRRTGEFSIMIGLSVGGEPELGVIYEPTSDRLYWGLKNQGAFLEQNGKKKKLKASLVKDFSQMTLLMSRNHTGEVEVELAKKLKVKKSVKIGSCGIKIVKIAGGSGEIYINSSSKSSQWDTCAGVAILQEAGGKITDMNGNELVYNERETRHLKGHVTSNGLKHGEIIKALKERKENL